MGTDAAFVSSTSSTGQKNKWRKNLYMIETYSAMLLIFSVQNVLVASPEGRKNNLDAAQCVKAVVLYCLLSCLQIKGTEEVKNQPLVIVMMATGILWFNEELFQCIRESGNIHKGQSWSFLITKYHNPTVAVFPLMDI